MKTCFICKQEKDISLYYRDCSKTDGYRISCKDCDRLRYRERRERNPKTYRDKDKNYYERNKEAIRQRRKASYPLNRQKHLARGKVKTALYKGLIVKQNCIECGSQNTQAHHEDYDKPLDVVWLCPQHHMRLHHGKV